MRALALGSPLSPGGVALACGSAGIATLGFGHPCESIYGSSFDNTIDSTTEPAVRAALDNYRDPIVAVQVKAEHHTALARVATAEEKP